MGYDLFASQYNWVTCLITRLMEPQAIEEGEYVPVGKDMYFVYMGQFQAGETELELVFSPGCIFGAFEEYIGRKKPLRNVRACPRVLSTDIPYCQTLVIRSYKLINNLEP